VSPAKTAEPIEMPFAGMGQVGQRNHVLDRVLGMQIPDGNGQFLGWSLPLKGAGRLCSGAGKNG